jgi:hypothetical protein
MSQSLQKPNPKSTTVGCQLIKTDRHIPPDVDAEQTPKTRAFVHQFFDRIESLERRIEKLEALLASKKTPLNSSLPPSSVHPHSKPASRKPKSIRKQGGQPGHQRHTRPLLPTEQCDRVEKLMPSNAAAAINRSKAPIPSRGDTKSASFHRSNLTPSNTNWDD